MIGKFFKTLWKLIKYVIIMTLLSETTLLVYLAFHNHIL